MLEETPVLDGRPELERTLVELKGMLEVPGGRFVTVLDRESVVLEGTPVEVEESVPLVLVKVAERQSVVTGISMEKCSRGGVEVEGGSTVDTVGLDATRICLATRYPARVG